MQRVERLISATHFLHIHFEQMCKRPLEVPSRRSVVHVFVYHPKSNAAAEYVDAADVVTVVSNSSPLANNLKGKRRPRNEPTNERAKEGTKVII